MLRIISLHISCIQKWLGTNIIPSLLHTTSLHISCVLKRSGTYPNDSGSVRMASSHISCILRWSGNVTIQLVMFTYTLKDHPKNVVSGHQTQKAPVYAHNFSASFFFHLQENTNPTTLMGSKQWALNLLLFLLFGS